MLLRDRPDSGLPKVNLTQFEKLLEENRVIEADLVLTPSSKLVEISGRYKAGPDEEANATLSKFKGEIPFRFETFLSEEKLQSLVLAHEQLLPKQPDTMLIGILLQLGPFLLLAFIIYFFFIRQIKMAGKGAMSFGKSRAKMLSRDKNKITFKDVAGVDEAKEEVGEIVDFLKDPRKFQRLGGRIPKGILMVGAPGTGKTLLAKAIAGEADASFFSISGSDFVEMFVGVGASRVRDMFEQARKNTPCLIFIDEIDAVGRSRGVGLGGGNDEREQTLNALLVEMDGFDSQDGVIIIAATNRPDVLDPALLRPGRFDRQLTVNLPDVVGREQILKVHARKVKLAAEVDLKVVARGTPGYSGAELANLLNEAALLAARQNKKEITHVELEEARDKVRWGRERRSLAMTDEDKKFTAWHEAGHALVNVLLEHTHPLHKVTIIPRGQSLGSTMSLPEKDVYNRRKKEMLDMIAVTMGGRIAEEIVSGDISTGAAGDIQQASALARAMVCQFGMSENVGMVQYGSDDEVYMGRDMIRKKDYSEEFARIIDAEVKTIIDTQYTVAQNIILDHRDKLELIAKALLEYETLDGQQVHSIVKTGSFNPPTKPPVDTSMPGQEAVTPISDVSKKTPPELPGLGSPAPAPI
ncbi:MAG: ATP-dependent zinc metalloprotease FtsH [Verrucomicrobia bacterium]|nr:ATP-dependent zinc metalloprotease FtsH [Verrucomicrobiota bacterium]